MLFSCRKPGMAKWKFIEFIVTIIRNLLPARPLDRGATTKKEKRKKKKGHSETNTGGVKLIHSWRINIWEILWSFECVTDINED